MINDKFSLPLFLLLCFLFLLPSITWAGSYTMRLNDVRAADLARLVYGDVLHKSFTLDDEVLNSKDEVTVNWVNLSKSETEAQVRDLLTHRGFDIQARGDVLLIRKKDKQDEGILVYQPRNRSARYLSDVLQRVADAKQLGTRGLQASADTQAAMSKTPEVQGSAASVIDRSATDQLAYSCNPSQCDKLRGLLDQLDTPEAQVVLRAAVYEVGTTKGEGSALQLVAHLFNGKATITAGSVLSASNQMQIGTNSLDAVLSLLDTDSHFKVVSRPMLRVKTGSQAKFSVGQQVPVLGAMSLDKNGNPVQSVDYRQAGTIFTVSPDVRQDVVDLNVTQELSSFVQTTTGVNNSPTLLQRTANSQLTIKPGEVVVFAGLEETRDVEASSHLFSFRTSKQSDATTSQVLLFIEAQRI